MSEKITHIDGVWAAKMDMMDMSGVRMTVDLSNEVKENHSLNQLFNSNFQFSDS